MTFHAEARRVDAYGSLTRTRNAEITPDTDLAGNPDAFHPAELQHDNVKKFGTVFNTVTPGTALSGVLRRKEAWT